MFEHRILFSSLTGARFIFRDYTDEKNNKRVEFWSKRDVAVGSTTYEVPYRHAHDGKTSSWKTVYISSTNTNFIYRGTFFPPLNGKVFSFYVGHTNIAAYPGPKELHVDLLQGLQIVRVKHQGQWHPAAPYVKNNGVWVPAEMSARTAEGWHTW